MLPTVAFLFDPNVTFTGWFFLSRIVNIFWPPSLEGRLPNAFEFWRLLLWQQAMDELDLRDFTYGGVNITGFALVDSSLHYDIAPLGLAVGELTVPNKLTVSSGCVQRMPFSLSL